MQFKAAVDGYIPHLASDLMLEKIDVQNRLGIDAARWWLRQNSMTVRTGSQLLSPPSPHTGRQMWLHTGMSHNLPLAGTKLIQKSMRVASEDSITLLKLARSHLESSGVLHTVTPLSEAGIVDTLVDAGMAVSRIVALQHV